MRRALALVLLLACGTDAPGSDAGSGSTSAASSTTTPTSGTGALATTSTTNAETGASTTTGADDSISFLDSADYPDPLACDPWSQDCPEGEKCAWYDRFGIGLWDGTKCVAVMENPAQLNEPCVADGATSGIDTCDKGMMCWHVDDEGQGYCIGLCHGTSEAPLCDAVTAACAVFNSEFGLCLAKCDPLTLDCDPGDLCIGNKGAHAFVCVLDASGDEGQQHDPCMFANACDPGFVCTTSADAAECDQSALGCCQPFCDLNDPDADAKCGGVGQVCTPYLVDGVAVPEFEHVGYCAVPM